jgi:hypothetical protein
MATLPDFETRLSDLERQVAALKARRPDSNVPAIGWVDQVSGSMKDHPEFQEEKELGRASRQADRPTEPAGDTA